MLGVFKKYQSWLIICECVFAVFATALIADGKSIVLALAVFSALSLIAFAVLQVLAGLMHQRLLSILYILKKPGNFIAAYTPLTEQRHVRKNVLFTMKAYLANAYAAKGSFKKALDISSDMPKLSGKRQRAAIALISANRTNYYIDAQELDKALEEHERFLINKYCARGSLRRELDVSGELLELKLAIAQGKVDKDIESRARVHYLKGGSALHMAQLNLMLGQMYLKLGSENTARDYLKDAAKAGSELWCAKEAARLLKNKGENI